MADIGCDGSPSGTCNGLKYNICASFVWEHRGFRLLETHFEVIAVYAEHLMIPGNQKLLAMSVREI
jgi:hypothetical protein